MLFKWNEETTRWYTNANAYTGFYDHLSSIILPKLKGCQTLCDMGCGLGLIDLAFAPHFERITCVDVNENAIATLKENARQRGITNIDALAADCDDVPGSWDAIYICFFGSRQLDKFLHRCKKLIVIVGGDQSSELFPGKYRAERKNSITSEQHYLDEFGVPYSLSLHYIEFGQPFTSHEDARAYVRSYAKSIPDAELDAFLRQRLVETDDPAFPLFMPRLKNVGVFEIDAGL